MGNYEMGCMQAVIHLWDLHKLSRTSTYFGKSLILRKVGDFLLHLDIIYYNLLSLPAKIVKMLETDLEILLDKQTYNVNISKKSTIVLGFFF